MQLQKSAIQEQLQNVSNGTVSTDPVYKSGQALPQFVQHAGRIPGANKDANQLQEAMKIVNQTAKTYSRDYHLQQAPADSPEHAYRALDKSINDLSQRRR